MHATGDEKAYVMEFLQQTYAPHHFSTLLCDLVPAPPPRGLKTLATTLPVRAAFLAVRRWEGMLGLGPESQGSTLPFWSVASHWPWLGEEQAFHCSDSRGEMLTRHRVSGAVAVPASARWGQGTRSSDSLNAQVSGPFWASGLLLAVRRCSVRDSVTL